MDQNSESYVGIYHFFGITLDVREGEGGLEAAVSGAPPGYEIGLEPAGEALFRMRGGPLDGAAVEFLAGEDGIVRTLKAGGYELARVDPEALAGLDIVERFEAPPFELDPEKEAAFAGLYASEVAPADGRRIAYRLPYPKSEFVRYLMAKDTFIFHGSGNRDIEEFEPVRTSVELYDTEERGNLPAVYGTHDALWAMFFAVVDRGRLDGSIRNGVLYVHNREGAALPLYNFSINRDNLPDRPYHTGALYFLPRDTFARQKMSGGSPANEWASLRPVRPAASILIEPEDFPFLDRIGGHDDGPLVRSQAIQRRLLGEADHALVLGPDRRRLVFGSEADLEADVREYIALQAEVMPGVRYAFDPGPPPSLEIGAIPPAMGHVLDAAFKARGLA